MKHIPYKLLDGSCVLRCYGDADFFGGRKVISETPLRRVRIELYRKKDVSKVREAVFSYGRLYYDCGRSIPDDAVFSSDGDMSVIIDREEFLISEIRYNYAGGRLRFIALELKG